MAGKDHRLRTGGEDAHVLTHVEKLERLRVASTSEASVRTLQHAALVRTQDSLASKQFPTFIKFWHNKGK